MFRKKVKKAFTLVELLVVIAILAILATVSVVGYTQFTKRAQQSNDMSLTTQINTVLQADEVTGKPQTMTEAIAVMEEAGANIAELTPTTEGYSYVWNSATNRVILLDGKKVVAPADATIDNPADCYAIIKAEPDLTTWAGYSLYLTKAYTDDVDTDVFDLTSLVSVDVGTSAIKTLNIDTEATGTATIYTTEGSTVTVKAANATINHYGAAASVDVQAVADNSYHLYATVSGNVTLTAGRLVAEANSSAAAVIVDVENTAAVENVTVEIKSNSAISAVAATKDGVMGALQEAGNLTGGENTSVETVVVDPENKDFAGGLGTEASPYLIANEEQFKNIDTFYRKAGIVQTDLSTSNLSAINSLNIRYYFEITTDLVLESEQVLTSVVYNAEIDGGANVVKLPRESMMFYYLVNAKLSNMTVEFSGAESSIVYYNFYSSFDGVTTTGISEVSGNVGLFTIYLYYYADGEMPVTFTNCRNEAYTSGTGTYSDYNAVFVGYLLPYGINTTVDLTFTNCVNAGEFVCGKAAMFVGNIPSGTVALDIKINNCENTGRIRATYEGSLGSPIVGTYALKNNTGDTFTSTNSIVTINGTVNSDQFQAELNGGYGFEMAANSGMAIAGEYGGQLTLTESNNDLVAYYVVYVGTYVTWLKVDESGEPIRDESGNYQTEGTYRVYITETVNKEQFTNGTYTTKLCWYGFTTDQSGSQKSVAEIDVNDTTATDNKYLIPNCDACISVSGNSLVQSKDYADWTMVSVSAFDAEGNLISSTSVPQP